MRADTFDPEDAAIRGEESWRKLVEEQASPALKV